MSDDPKAAPSHVAGCAEGTYGVAGACNCVGRAMSLKAAPSLTDIAQHIEDWYGDLWAQASVVEEHIPRIVAALRAVEAVRALKTCATECRSADYCDGYHDGVEAVQALLEGER